jgi:hypothetical protein
MVSCLEQRARYQFPEILIEVGNDSAAGLLGGGKFYNWKHYFYQ